MKRLIIFVLVLALFTASSGITNAQESVLMSVRLEGISFNLDNALALGVSVRKAPADPVDEPFPGGPLPAHTEFTLVGYQPLAGADEFGGIIRVVKTADLKGYEVNEAIYAQLQKLLLEKPALSAYEKPDLAQHSMVLPHLYPPPAAQILRARAAYVETDHMIGIRYLAAYAQDVSPLTSDQIIYLYQGISKQGDYLISAQFRFKTGLFSDEVPSDFNYERFAAALNEYLQASIDTLNSASDEEITPALFAMDDLVESFQVNAEGETGIQGILWKLKAFIAPTNEISFVVEPDRYTLLISATQMGHVRSDCNTLTAPTLLDGESLTIDMSQAQTTLVGCPADSLEAQYNAALGKVSSYFFVQGALILRLTDGGSLRFEYEK